MVRTMRVSGRTIFPTKRKVNPFFFCMNSMREKMDAMQQEFERFFHYLQSHADELTNFVEPPAEGTTDALVPITRAAALRRRSASRS
jgi:hypothetical protein